MLPKGWGNGDMRKTAAQVQEGRTAIGSSPGGLLGLRWVPSKAVPWLKQAVSLLGRRWVKAKLPHGLALGHAQAV